MAFGFPRHATAPLGSQPQAEHLTIAECGDWPGSRWHTQLDILPGQSHTRDMPWLAPTVPQSVPSSVAGRSGPRNTRNTRKHGKVSSRGECYGIQCPVFEVHRDQSRGLTPGPAHQLSHYPKATVARIVLYPPFTHILLFREFPCFLFSFFSVFRIFRVRTICPYLVPPPARGCRKA
jgi:hypothetical protein